jgi:hypothetical protein
MRLFLGLLIFSIGSFSFAGTQYQCVGSAKVKSKPQAVIAKDLPKNFEIAPTATKLKVTIEKIYCPQAKNDELFLISSNAPLKEFDYQAYFNPLPNRILKQNDSVYFRVVWNCDKKCREKNWSEISEPEFAKEYADDTHRG